jgi:hypothetical protein
VSGPHSVESATPSAIAYELGDRAGAWLADNIDIFVEAAFRPELSSPALKALCDIALLVRCRTRHATRTSRVEWRGLEGAILQYANSPSYLLTVRSHPRDLQLYGLPYLAATALGGHSSEIRSAIRDVVASGAAHHVERRPTEQLGVLYFVESAGLASPVGRVREIVATTLLAQRPDPHRMLPIDGYVIAHTVFYLTHFGERPIHSVPQSVGDIRNFLTALIRRFSAADNSDLVAELAAALLCLTPNPGPVFVELLQYLDQRRRDDGTIAANLPARYLAMGSSHYARRTWAHQHYHTAVLAALLATLVEVHQLRGRPR